MNFIKCAKCGREDPAFDYAHVCGPVEVKQTVMNQRIKELAEQVYGSAHYDDFKFAELIVRECALICESRPGPGDDVRSRQHCGLQILEHFGVEE